MQSSGSITRARVHTAHIIAVVTSSPVEMAVTKDPNFQVPNFPRIKKKKTNPLFPGQVVRCVRVLFRIDIRVPLMGWGCTAIDVFGSAHNLLTGPVFTIQPVIMKGDLPETPIKTIIFTLSPRPGRGTWRLPSSVNCPSCASVLIRYTVGDVDAGRGAEMQIASRPLRVRITTTQNPTAVITYACNV